MSPLFARPKKAGKMKRFRKKMSKHGQHAFLGLLVVVSMHFQTHLLEQTFVHWHAAHEGAFAHNAS